MKFFVPQASPAEYEATYGAIKKLVTEQLKTPITPRRIRRIDYLHDKKTYHLQVGSLEQQGRYEVLAILESKPYIIYTRTKSGQGGITILVNCDEVTAVEDFD